MAPKRSAATAAKKADLRPWPPKVPLGTIEDILPLIQADDDSLDSLMLPAPGLLGDDVPISPFGPAEMEYVCQCLRKNSSVTHLNASMNPIGDQGAKCVSEMLRCTGAGAGAPLPLARLSLNGCGIGAVGARALAEALETASELIVVELVNNEMGEDGGQALLEAVKRNKHLKEVKVSLNSISAETEAEIEKTLMLR
ncbi:Nucleotide-binding oligomerization domain-containing protein 1 (Caspase recruitment domain-containing protein 4) [Durusdinium trenchii]|uniref:Nucleotide-binding oligomerization domain-containing protein 1 (Caspase recruitment domain-containing protein 4) n=1 Tax=Durusdinium trenchii TaxID=1381693 RepID=A0ABP0R7K0_9DINO